MSRKSIIIKGARVNNLKNIDISLPRKELIVVTGPSGSGKSSLVFDTLFAEGQRRYVESLSSYARQFLSRMEKPDVDYIQGLSPAIALEQRVATNNPRSTVGTATEIYDYLKLLFARIGKTYSPISGDLVKRDTISEIVKWVNSQREGSKWLLVSEIPVRSKGIVAELELALQKGFSRIWEKGEILDIEDAIELAKGGKVFKKKQKFLALLIDRFRVKDSVDEETLFRMADSVKTAYMEGLGEAYLIDEVGDRKHFSQKFEKDGIIFEKPSVNFFAFNNPFGACKKCQGFGRILGIDPELVIPNKAMSVFEGAIAPWKGERLSQYKRDFLKGALEKDFPVHRSYFELSDKEKDLLWNGDGIINGINNFFQMVESQTQKIQYRVLLSRYRGYTVCDECRGTRIRKDANHVKIKGYSISDFLLLQTDQLLQVFQKLEFDQTEKEIGKRLLIEITTRLTYIQNVGLGYLSLNRKVGTLSGGEMQRIRLSTSLGSSLVGSMYILDEPSIGLHPRDTERLISILEDLRDQGNSVIVVEHDESIIRKGDTVVDMGPGAGELGGEVVFVGTIGELEKADTLTGRYLTGREKIEVPSILRKKVNSIKLMGARAQNLKNIDIEIPLNLFSVVTGVSGSGKTTLIKSVFFPALRRRLGEFSEKPGDFSGLEGDLDQVTGVEMVDQSPIGRSARSNPATYIKAWDHIRELFSQQALSKTNKLTPGHFSFNIEGGRCETCKGDGLIKIEMQFLPDVTLQCEACKGKRFKKDILEVRYREKNVSDVLNMTLSEALQFFEDEPKIKNKIEILNKVGLGYLRMGQSSSTLSGGEAQRVKLAQFLVESKGKKGRIFIFDEPTTGLHFDDIKKLLSALNQLIESGNTVIVIEHNLEVIKSADWIIDLGPQGGEKGGSLVFQGPLRDILKVKKSITAPFIAPKLK